VACFSILRGGDRKFAPIPNNQGLPMSAIAATGLSSSAIVSLLNSGLSSPPQPVPVTTQSGASPSSNPIDSLNLSDQAKAVLAQAQQEQVAANELQSFLQSAGNSNGNSNSSASNQTSGNNVLQNFDQLTGQSQSQAQSPQGNPGPLSLADFQQADGGWLAGLSAYAQALAQASQQPDGTFNNYSQTLNNVIAVPSTPQQISAWYQSDGKLLTGQEEAGQGNDPGLVEAIANHAITFLNANDIPGLNFQNTIVMQGGEDGGSGDETWTYNQNASIFSDPNTSYKVLGDGTVIAWKTPPGVAAAASN
jgi:hypothetical protein